MMKLKKVLSLVLVVAMIASMLIVGAAAAEAEETNYPEAAAVIAGIGVMEGDENGMRYQDTVTREEAAAIICRALLGDSAALLKTSTAPFADVAANRWSAGYITYLKNAGVINGVTDTTFDPTAEVTGVAFAKMLLTAVGYGKNGEYEGAAWDINTITWANQLGIFDGSKADVAAAATREECMLYAFNTITAVPTVNYNKTFETYYTGVSALNPAESPEELAEYTLAALKFNLRKGEAGKDALGRPAAGWLVGTVALYETDTATAVPYKTFTGLFTTADLYNALGKNVATNIDDKASELYSDGVAASADEKDKVVYPTPDLYGTTDYITGPNAHIELYVNAILDKDGKETGKYDVDIVIYTEHFDTVRSINTASKLLTLTNSKLTIDGKLNDISGLAKGDKVIYTKGVDGKGDTVIVDYREATPVVGTYTAYNSKYSTVVVDGITYVSLVAAPDAKTMGYSYDLYLDDLGNVLYMELSAAAEISNYDYLYVAEVGDYVNAGSLVASEAYVIRLRVAYATGGAAVLDYEILTDAYGMVTGTIGGKYIMFNGKPVAIAKTGDAKTAIDTGWYSYTANENGVALSEVNPVYATEFNGIKIADKSASVEVKTDAYAAYDKITSGSTVLTTISSAVSGGIATSVTGYSNFVGKTYESPVLVTYAKDSKTIKNIYVADAKVEAPKVPYAICIASGNTVVNGVEYTFVTADGSILSTIVAPTKDLPALAIGGVYTLTDTFTGSHVAVAAPVYSNDEGTVNAGNYLYKDYTPAGYATVDVVEDNAFTTLAVTDDDIVAGDEYKKCDSKTYYYDAETIVIDCTGNGATEIASGDIFVAYVDTDTISFNGLEYCTYIWIVG